MGERGKPWTHEGCSCLACEWWATLGPKSRAWVKEHGWFAHHAYPEDTDPEDYTALFTTVGLLPLYEHPEVEVLGDFGQDVAHHVIGHFAERVRDGERLEPGLYAGVLENPRLPGLRVKLCWATGPAWGRVPGRTLRAIVPDNRGKLERGELDPETFGRQYVGVEEE